MRKGGTPISEFESDLETQACAQERREGLQRYKVKTFGGGGRLIVVTDASDYGVGAAVFVMGNERDQVDELARAFASKQLIGIFFVGRLIRLL